MEIILSRPYWQEEVAEASPRASESGIESAGRDQADDHRVPWTEIE